MWSRFGTRSEYFDAHLHMHYLLRMEQSGVQDYLVSWLSRKGAWLEVLDIDGLEADKSLSDSLLFLF